MLNQWKVIVVDDEYWIRKGIIQLIPWDRLGLTLAGEAEDGEDAIALVAAVQPDIVLLDMRMPGLSGAELLQHFANQSKPQMMIVISGYADYEYTREAIRSNAFDYLLKPVKEHELVQVLEKACAELERRSTVSSLDEAQMRRNISDNGLEEGAEGKQVVASIVKLIEVNYSKPWSLHEIAKQEHMNPDYLSRLFKKITGKNFVEFLTDCRIEQAKLLLKKTNLKNYEVAVSVGYDDYRYFSQVFKKKLGMTIGEYRKRRSYDENCIDRRRRENGNSDHEQFAQIRNRF